MAASAYFDDETLKRGLVPKKSPKKAAKKTAAPAPVEAAPKAAPVIADKKIAEEVEAIRKFEREEIEPIFSDLPFYVRPKSTEGLTQIGALGLYCKTSDIVEYRARMRCVINARWAFKKSRLGGMFAVALIDNALDEAAALESCALNFHDDRGDGLLYVPALKAKATREAWERAAAALGIVTKCRPCAR